MSTTKATGFLFRTITVPSNGQSLTSKYAVYVPRWYDGSKPVPLILFLHGRGESGTDGQKTIAQGLGTAILFNEAAWPAIVLFPQKPTPESRWIDHEGLAMGVLEEARTMYNIDASRIYLTGLSQGGAGSWAIGAKHADVFAAVAPICGFTNTWDNGPVTPQSVADGISTLPIWTFHGLKDDVVLPKETEAIVTAVQAKQASLPGVPAIKATYFPDANHNSWDAAYRSAELPKWLFEQRRR
jgi:predicted peptidase